MIAIIDYDAGNLKSVEKALIHLNEPCIVTRDKEALLAADKLILPGVGAFGEAMAKLTDYGLVSVIREAAAAGKPFLGICLGMQLMFSESEESPNVAGLGLLPGRIVRLKADGGLTAADDKKNAVSHDFSDDKKSAISLESVDVPEFCGKLKIPHVGWNSLRLRQGSRLFKGLCDGTYVYFVHSYYLEAERECDVAATAFYGVHIHAAVEHENLFGCQFHPEKSGEAGLAILKNFAQL